MIFNSSNKYKKNLPKFGRFYLKYINITSLSCRNNYDDNNRNNIDDLFVHIDVQIFRIFI